MTDSLVAQVDSTLRAAGIRAALIGAGALAAHGVSRSTLDRDLLVTDARALDQRTWAALRGVAAIDVRRGDAEDPLHGVVRLSADPDQVVDVIVGRYDWQSRIVDEASPLSTPDGTIHVVSAAGLVLLKLYAGGLQDLWDVEQLRAVHGPGLDDAVEQRIGALPDAARRAWERVARRA